MALKDQTEESDLAAALTLAYLQHHIQLPTGSLFQLYTDLAVWWCSAYSLGLVMNRSQVQLPVMHCRISTCISNAPGLFMQV